MVRASSSGGSRQGKTVISAFGANEATSIEVWSGCAGVSSGSTRIGVRQLRMKSRDTLYRIGPRAIEVVKILLDRFDCHIGPTHAEIGDPILVAVPVHNIAVLAGRCPTV